MAVTLKACKGCGTALRRRKPSHLARAQYCSARCAYETRRKAGLAKQKPCVICGTVAKKPSGAKTCSAACGYEYRKRHTRSARKCLHCGLETTATNGIHIKYCSIRCYNAVRNKRPRFVPVQCRQCGASVKRTVAAIKRTKNTFCSRQCSATFHRGENSPLYRGDKDPNRGAAWNKLAQSIRVRDNYACRRCGLCETGNGQKLSVDHVRPWRSFEDKTLANHPDNLVSLCRPCHSFKTSTVEAAWLRGDVIAWRQFVASLHLPAVKFGWMA